jgi:hypothetical protein
MLGPGARNRYQYEPMTFEDAIDDIRKFFSLSEPKRAGPLLSPL